MLLVIMHNDKGYLDEALSIVHKAGVSEASIFEKKGLVKLLRGTRRNLFLSIGPPEITDVFDYALIAAVPGEGKVDQLKELLQNEPQLYLLAEEGLMFTFPYNNIKRLFKNARGGKEMLSLVSLITEERVRLELVAVDKVGVIKEMVEVLGNHERITDKGQLFGELMEREKLETTGIGNGIALPHARTDTVKELMVAFGRSKEGVEFKALDDKPVFLVFLIVAPRKDSSKALKILANICRIVDDKNLCQALLTAESKQKIIDLIEEKELS